MTGSGPFSAFGRHRSLTWELARRDVLGRYRGASFGLLWSLISPFLLLCIYTFAFGTVMGGRWPEIESGRTHFSIVLFAGLIVHGFLAECLMRAPELVAGNPSFVKRVVFPLEILPWPMVLSALFHSLMNVVVFLALRLWLDGEFTWTFVLLPLLVLPLAIPAVIFGAAAIEAAGAGLSPAPFLLLLGAGVSLALPLAPLAAGAALTAE